MFFTRSMFMVWSLGYIFSQACKSSSQAAAWVRGSMPGWELWSPGFDPIPQPEVTSTPSEACPSSVAVTWDRCSPRCPAWLSKYPQQKHFGSLLSAVQVSLSQGLFPGGEIFFAWKSLQLEGRGRRCIQPKSFKGNLVLCPTFSKVPSSNWGASGNISPAPWYCRVGAFQQGTEKKKPKKLKKHNKVIKHTYSPDYFFVLSCPSQRLSGSSHSISFLWHRNQQQQQPPAWPHVGLCWPQCRTHTPPGLRTMDPLTFHPVVIWKHLLIPRINHSHCDCRHQFGKQ